MRHNKYKYKQTGNLFRLLSRVNPVLALLGTFSLSNSWVLGWYILIIYNVLNIYIYLSRKEDFLIYALMSSLHFSFGIWAIIHG